MAKNTEIGRITGGDITDLIATEEVQFLGFADIIICAESVNYVIAGDVGFSRINIGDAPNSRTSLKKLYDALSQKGLFLSRIQICEEDRILRSQTVYGNLYRAKFDTA